MDHHQCGQLRGAPCRRVEHLLCPHPGGHRTGTVVPPDGATRARRVVLLGLRGLVLRGRPRPDLHRNGVCPHGSPRIGVPLRADRADGMAPVRSRRRRRGDRTERRLCVVGRRTGHRRGGNPASGVVRVLVTGGRPVPPSRQPDPDVSLECDHGHVLGRAERLLPLSQQLWQPLRQRWRGNHVAAGYRFAGRRVRAPRVPSTDSVPRRRWPLGDVLLGERSGSWRHLHGLGNRPELRPAHRAPGAGHGAGRCSRIRRRGSPRSRPRSFAIPCWCWGAWWRSWRGSSSVRPTQWPPRRRPARRWPA